MPRSFGRVLAADQLDTGHAWAKHRSKLRDGLRDEIGKVARALNLLRKTQAEIKVLRDMVEGDKARLDNPEALARTNRRFHKQLHLASHNRYLIQQLDMVHRTMALLATTSLAAEGRAENAVGEHEAIVTAIEARDPEAAGAALKSHISRAFETRLKLDAGGSDLPV